MHHESERLGVEVVDQQVEPPRLGFGVGRVAEQAEGEAARGELRGGAAR